ncbi:uncharacterized protein LOC126382436 [Pectinophora gossypiella]|uniref:uncharacterized protein LOC126382436 n=1 Tax=Pectinophora gossypiella TaxID=13191 RepID=UPI00214E1D4E|nr:uncharacterized protein LOC126382436 [Pectinophora gossypiella]
MKLLRKSFNTQVGSKNDREPESVAVTIMNIRKHVRLYYKILDNLQEAEFQFQIWLLTTITFSFLKILGCAYGIMNKHPQIDMSQASIYSVDLALDSFLAMVPSMFMELAANEADKMKNCLTIKISRCKNQLLREEMQHALNAFNFRPVEMWLCRCVPVNATLPISYVCATLTYIVTMMQFLQFKFTATDGD